jgi:hypothetical protein
MTAQDIDDFCTRNVRKKHLTWSEWRLTHCLCPVSPLITSIPKAEEPPMRFVMENAGLIFQSALHGPGNRLARPRTCVP